MDRRTARQELSADRGAKVNANARDMIIVAPNSKVIRNEEAKTIAPPMMEKSSMKATYAENAILYSLAAVLFPILQTEEEVRSV